MTRIDFYVLKDANRAAQIHFACRLAEKAVQQGNKVVIASPDDNTTAELDRQLWQFKPEAFLPHAVAHGESAASPIAEPIIISDTDSSVTHHDVLINLKPELLGHFSRFKRLAEIVIQEPAVLQATRNNYAYYKDRGYLINTHKL